MKETKLNISLYRFKNAIAMLWSIILVRLFKFKYDKSIIPEGLYCYVAVDEKIKMLQDLIFI